eukprot:270917-Lingulodinium_polyedra.AAC.1
MQGEDLLCLQRGPLPGSTEHFVPHSAILYIPAPLEAILHHLCLAKALKHQVAEVVELGLDLCIL